jgi:hypothetical protein
VERVFLLWISGGAIGLAVLAYHYCHDSMAAAAMGGMPAVAALPGWKEQLARNPANRERLLAEDAGTFIQTMKTWGEAFVPASDSPVPGTTAAQLQSLKMPTLILRSGASDIHHPRVTSEAVHALIPGSRIAASGWTACKRKPQARACSRAGRCSRRKSLRSRTAERERGAYPPSSPYNAVKLRGAACVQSDLDR